MKGGSRIAVSVLGGYLLGRSGKTRLAVLLALMAAAGRLPENAGELLRRTALGESLDKVIGDLRGQVSATGAEMAKKAASSPVESLGDILHERAEALRAESSLGGRVRAGKVGEAGERAGDLLTKPLAGARRGEEEEHGGAPRGRGRGPEQDEYEEEEYGEEGGAYEGEEDEAYEEEPVREARPRRRASRPEEELVARARSLR